LEQFSLKRETDWKVCRTGAAEVEDERGQAFQKSGSIPELVLLGAIIMVGAILMARSVFVAGRYRLCRSISGQSGKRLFREITAGTKVLSKLQALLYIRGIANAHIIEFREHALQSISRSRDTSQGVVHSTYR
jgi:hypothetical protein